MQPDPNNWAVVELSTTKIHYEVLVDWLCDNITGESVSKAIVNRYNYTNKGPGWWLRSTTITIANIQNVTIWQIGFANPNDAVLFRLTWV